MYRDANAVPVEAVRNEARTKIAELSEQQKGGKFMVKIPAESRPVKIGKEAVIDAILKSMGIDRATNMAPEVIKTENRLRKLFAESPDMIDMLQTNMPPAGEPTGSPASLRTGRRSHIANFAQISIPF